jgi:hypothetical protein
VHARFAALERALVEAIAARTGTDPDRDAYPQLVAGVTTISMKVAMRRWTSSDDGRSLEEYVEESIDVVRRGL